MTAEQIADEVNLLDVDRLVISGGEPMIQQKKLPAVMSLLAQHKTYQFEIETAGTLVPDIEMHRRDIQWNVSPKLEHSGNPYDKRFVPDALHALNALEGNFKFVVQKVSDLDEVQDIVTMIGIPSSRIFIMPEGIEPEVIDMTAREIADAVLIQGWNFTTRLHVQLWGDVRGK
jgi:organic radical activating enzyme